MVRIEKNTLPRPEPMPILGYRISVSPSYLRIGGWGLVRDTGKCLPGSADDPYRP
jgi:hypothetical protein